MNHSDSTTPAPRCNFGSEIFALVKHNHVLDHCPVCGSKAEIYRRSEGDTNKVAVMCSNGDPIGPQKDIDLPRVGCLLSLPPEEFYQPSIRQAVSYWKRYYWAIRVLRAESGAFSHE